MKSRDSAKDADVFPRRYAGVGGYKDDGMNTYRAQAIRKDILDWDVDETALDNETLADPEVLLGS